jgi:predicted RNA-binding Zn ribbon-like protein
MAERVSMYRAIPLPLRGATQNHFHARIAKASPRPLTQNWSVFARSSPRAKHARMYFRARSPSRPSRTALPFSSSVNSPLVGVSRHGASRRMIIDDLWRQRRPCGGRWAQRSR